MFECRKAKGDPQPEYRKCCACGELKHAKTHFYWSDQDTGTYPTGRCKDCCLLRQRKYRETRKAKYAEYARASRKRNPDAFATRDAKVPKEKKLAYKQVSKAKRALRLAGTAMKCARCGITKSADADFHSYNQPCKACHSKRCAELAAQNPDAKKAKRKRYYQENKDQHVRKAAEWKAANRERARESANRRAKTEAGRARQRQANWERRARIHNAKVEGARLITHDWFLQLCAEHNHRCFYCWGQGMKLSADHVIAIASGGKHVRENIVPSCKSCNSRKSDNDATKFRPAISIAAYGLELASA